MDAAELSALWVLHRAGACLGEQVEVIRESARIFVRGLASSPERRQALTAALDEVVAAGLVAVEIRTFEEARQAELNAPDEQPRLEVRTPVTADASPVEEKLASHFHARLPGRDPEEVRRQIVEFLNTGMTLSAASLDHAWALRRLAERFPAERIRKLPPHSRWLLEAPFREHTAAVHGSIAGLEALTAPFAEPLEAQPRWNRERDKPIALFGAVEKLHARVTGMLAGRDRIEEPEQAWHSLAVLLHEVEVELTDFEERVAALLSGRSGVSLIQIPGVNP